MTCKFHSISSAASSGKGWTCYFRNVIYCICNNLMLLFSPGGPGFDSLLIQVSLEHFEKMFFPRIVFQVRHNVTLLEITSIQLHLLYFKKPWLWFNCCWSLLLWEPINLLLQAKKAAEFNALWWMYVYALYFFFTLNQLISPSSTSLLKVNYS